MRSRSWLLPPVLLLLLLGLSGCDCASGDDDDSGDGDADADGDGDGDGDGDADVGPPVTDCESNLTPPAGGGICEVADGDDNLFLQGTVLTRQEIFVGGGVVIDAAGAITCVGCDCATAAEAQDATLVTCAQGVISPGIIDAHNHLEYSYNPPSGHGAERYEHRHDWREGDRGHSEIPYGSRGSAENEQWSELRAALAGTTSYVGSGQADGMIRNLHGNQEGLNQGDVDFDTFPLGDIRGEYLESGCQYPDLPTGSADRVDAYLPHVAEGIVVAARNEFICMSSDDAGADVLKPSAAFIHAIGLNALDASLLATDSAKMVWSPRSNIDLYGNTAAVSMYDRQGTRIALGTDWTVSGSMNMLRELECADQFNRDYLDGYFGDWDLWEMATINAARASAIDDAVGRLAVGEIGDVAIFDGTSGLTFRAVLEAGVEDVVLVLRGGEPLAGDADVVQALPGGGTGLCEVLPFDVCGTQKAACLEREIGVTFATLQAANQGSYPLFFCDEPQGEPTCVPSRPNEYAGITGDDMDGDGVEDGQDLCPTVFNPIRPMDGGFQADFDGDGLGDVCDPCPLSLEGQDCPAVDATDLDGDGFGDEDNCPVVPNPDQADGDEDGHGDACDPCPEDANPGGAACPATIYDIKQNRFPLATRVALDGVVVTARAGNSFFVQVPEADQDGVLGASYSGLLLYVPNANPDNLPLPNRGDLIAIEGQVAAFHNELELSFLANLDVLASGQALPSPVVVTPDEVGGGGQRAEELERVLARAEGDVTAVDADGNATLDGALTLGDTMYLPDPTPQVDDSVEVTGILRVYNAAYTLDPRDDVDVRYLLMGDPRLRSFGPSPSFVDEGAANVVPVPDLRVTLDRAAPVGGTVVALESADPGRLTVPASITIPEGATSGQVTVSGLVAGDAAVDVTATLGGDDRIAGVVVVDPARQPVAQDLTPDPADVIVAQSTTFTVTLDIPARAGGAVVDLSLAPGNAATLDGGATVTVAAGAVSATFGVTGTGAGDELLTASFGGVDVTAQLTCIASIGIGGWELEQTASARVFTFPAGTMVSPGDYIIVARDATQDAFETFWGISLGPNVHFFSGGGSWPNMNGQETYELFDDAGASVDGPTIALAENHDYQRTSPDADPTVVGSWTDVASAVGNTTPGAGGVASDAWSGLYISEFSDATGGGNFVYEFVELYYE